MSDEQETLEMPTSVVAPGHVIELGKLWAPWEGQWVRIKPHRSYASKVRTDSARSQMTMSTDDRTTMSLALRTLEYAIVTVQEYVLEWRLVDVDGQPIEASRKGITGNNVDFDLMDQAIGEIADFYEKKRPPVFRESASSD